jgi:hypothetical protein
VSCEHSALFLVRCSLFAAAAAAAVFYMKYKGEEREREESACSRLSLLALLGRGAGCAWLGAAGW